MNKILLIVEHDNKKINPTFYSLVTAAQTLGNEICAFVGGHACQAIAQMAASTQGVTEVLLADHAVYQHLLPENLSLLLVGLLPAFSHVFAAANTFGKNLLPRLAALADSSMISDVTQIISADEFVHPMYAGNILERVKLTEKIKLLTIRTTHFTPVTLQQTAVEIKILSQVFSNDLSAFVSQELTPAVRPSLASAKIIVAGGRGLKSADNFKLLEKLADKLGAAIGATRAAVDANFAPNDFQIGQTGKIVAPDLYIALGISGAIQHLAGMKESKTIVAINNDPDAPIFQIADFYLVEDLFIALKEFDAALTQQ